MKLYKKPRYLDKLIDELAEKAMEDLENDRESARRDSSSVICLLAAPLSLFTDIHKHMKR